MLRGLSRNKKGSEEGEETMESDPTQETKWLIFLSVFLLMGDLPWFLRKDPTLHPTLRRASSSDGIMSLKYSPSPPEKETPQSPGTERAQLLKDVRKNRSLLITHC